MSTTEFFYTDVDLSGNTLSNSEITSSEISNSKIQLEIVTSLPVLGSDDGVWQHGRLVMHEGVLKAWTLSNSQGQTPPILDESKQTDNPNDQEWAIGEWRYVHNDRKVYYKVDGNDSVVYNASWELVGSDASQVDVLENRVSDINNQVESLSANKADATTVSDINNQVESLSANKADATVVNELKTKLDDFYEITDQDTFDESMDSLRELQTTIKDLKDQDDSIEQLIATNSNALTANSNAVVVERNRITKDRKEKKFDNALGMYTSPTIIKNLVKNNFDGLMGTGYSSISGQLTLIFSPLIKAAMTIAVSPKTGTPLYSTLPGVLNYLTTGGFVEGTNADGTAKYANSFQEFLEENPEFKDQVPQIVSMINSESEHEGVAWQKDTQDYGRLSALMHAVVSGYNINLTFSRNGKQLRIPYSTSVGLVSSSYDDFFYGPENETLREYIGAGDFPATIEVSSDAKGIGLNEGDITVDLDLSPTANNFFTMLLAKRIE